MYLLYITQGGTAVLPKMITEKAKMDGMLGTKKNNFNNSLSQGSSLSPKKYNSSSTYKQK